MRVLIADDHLLFRHGLRSLLEARGIEVVGAARNGREAVERTRRFDPDVNRPSRQVWLESSWESSRGPCVCREPPPMSRRS